VFRYNWAFFGDRFAFYLSETHPCGIISQLIYLEENNFLYKRIWDFFKKKKSDCFGIWY